MSSIGNTNTYEDADGNTAARSKVRTVDGADSAYADNENSDLTIKYDTSKWSFKNYYRLYTFAGHSHPYYGHYCYYYGNSPYPYYNWNEDTYTAGHLLTKTYVNIKNDNDSITKGVQGYINRSYNDGVEFGDLYDMESSNAGYAGSGYNNYDISYYHLSIV